MEGWASSGRIWVAVVGTDLVGGAVRLGPFGVVDLVKDPWEGFLAKSTTGGADCLAGIFNKIHYGGVVAHGKWNGVLNHVG